MEMAILEIKKTFITVVKLQKYIPINPFKLVFINNLTNIYSIKYYSLQVLLGLHFIVLRSPLLEYVNYLLSKKN